MSEKDARTWAMWCHLSALSGLVGVPMGSILGPLVCWLIKKDAHPMIDEHGKAALNFQITMTIAALVSGLLIFVCVGFVLLPVVLVMDIICTIIAAMKAGDGVLYEYPMTIKFIK